MNARKKVTLRSFFTRKGKAAPDTEEPQVIAQESADTTAPVNAIAAEPTPEQSLYHSLSNGEVQPEQRETHLRQIGFTDEGASLLAKTREIALSKYQSEKLHHHTNNSNSSWSIFKDVNNAYNHALIAQQARTKESQRPTNRV